MTQLQSKSEMNLAAANVLNNQSLYCSSVHCSYYSCVQLIKHIIIHKIQLTEKELEQEFKEYNKNNPYNRIGTHEFYINKTLIYIKDKLNREDNKLFNNEIVSLKKERVKSDYYDIMIDYDCGRKSLDKANEIIKVLKKVA